MPLDTKHLFVTSPKLGKSIYLNVNLDLDRPPRRRRHCRIFSGSGIPKPRRAAMPMCHGWPRSLSRVDLFKSEVSITHSRKHQRVIKETSRDDPNNRERPARGEPSGDFSKFWFSSRRARSSSPRFSSDPLMASTVSYTRFLNSSC